ncbi:MAG: flagellar motor stator protein MotA [Rickettsiaceae bacterium]
MLFLIGVITVVASVVLGYKMHAGDLSLLFQPNEFIIIIGSAIGSLLIGTSYTLLSKTIKSLSNLFARYPYSKDDYLELLLFMFNSFKLIKVKGMLEIESHIENISESDLFAQASSLSKNPTMLEFVRDNLRLIIMGVDNKYHFEDIVDKEIELKSEDINAPSKVLLHLADALPALGIVGAVLGVIITMRSIAEPPEILGSLIAAALVGTFTGVLLAYGLVGPIAHYLMKFFSDQIRYLECIKIGFISYLNGDPPIILVEFMRKSIPEEVRPNFDELDQYISNYSMKLVN